MGGYAFWVAALVLFLVGMVRLLAKIVWEPMRVRKHLEIQGIRGPKYKLLTGNLTHVVELSNEANRGPPLELRSHAIVARVLPEIHRWSAIHGKNFVYWFGPVARVVVPQPELIKELLCGQSGKTAFEKPEPPVQLRNLTGDGLANSRGEKWARQRRIIGAAFHFEALKGMLPAVVASTAALLDKWDRIGLAAARLELQVEVLEELRQLSADIIARTAFGSSFTEGKHIFDLQTEQALLAAESFKRLCIPGYRFLPTPLNLKGRRLDRQIQKALVKIIEKREQSLFREGRISEDCGDLLGIMMSACARNEDAVLTTKSNNSNSNNQRNNKKNVNVKMSFQEMVDECKTFFVAGHETTSLLLTWSLLLLAMHSRWQELARNEVLSVCQNRPPTADALARLKTVNMILHEVLRLYPPLPFLIRRAVKRAELGKLIIPEGAEILVPIAAVHHDAEIWGSDADEFKPERFAEGAARACAHPMAFMPFGLGPRTCVGSNFSLIHSKIVLAMLLQRFSFRLAPSYVHAPCQNYTIRPGHGAPLIFTPIISSPS